LQAQIKERLQQNLATLDATLRSHPQITRLSAEAGWHAVLRVPALGEEEQLALDLLTQRRTVVHTGKFFGFDGCGWLVISLLPRVEDFRNGIEAIASNF
jgi:alanine-synthesizing transaminase